MAHFKRDPGSTLNENLSPKDQNSRTLYVVAHGIGRSQEMQADLIDHIKQLHDKDEAPVTIWAPILPWKGSLGTVFCFGKMTTLIDRLASELNQIWKQGKYDRVVFIGNSLGGLVLRAMYLKGSELNPNGDTVRSRHWSQPTVEDRMVLLAAVNKGIGPTRGMSAFKALGIQVASSVLTALEPVLPHLVNTVRRNSSFISTLRLSWASEAERLKDLKVVQLLGSRDDIVSPDDSLDLVTGKNFYYLDVPQTSHEEILKLGKNTPEAAPRWRAIKAALTYDDERLEKEEVRPWGLRRPAFEETSPNFTGQCGTAEIEETNNVIFVVHGIRDPGYWTDKIARRIWKQGKQKGLVFERVVDSYGYFGMGPFLLPWYRRKKVHWLIERYIEARAKYPDAKFHFVGHSHGTYLLAKMLELFPDCRFENVVFAGSVVRRGYPWKSRQRDGQVRRLLNFVATKDWVVAFFPRIFDLWNIQDLGGAGHLGFEDASADEERFEIRYVVGGHSAAREEEMWDAIAEFVIGTPTQNLPSPLLEFQQGNKDYTGKLEHSLSGTFAKSVRAFSNVSIVLLVVLPVLLLAYVPNALINWFVPLVGQVSSTIEVSAMGAFASIAVVIATIFAVSQKKYGRSMGIVRSCLAAVIFTGTLYLIWARFPDINAIADSTGHYSRVDAAFLSGAMTVLWLGAMLWLLRKI